MKSEIKTENRKIAFIGNYLPRQCGIATFTTDVCESIAAEFPASECFTLAINDHRDGYDYPARVKFEIPQEDLKMYRSAADYLNLNDVDLVCVQHEFGIFGGKAGSHLLTLLRGIHTPVVTTFHTILSDPTPEQRLVFNELTQRSDRVVVMSQLGQTYMQEIYGVPPEKIDLIPHGIPDVPFVDPNYYKDKYDLEGKKVLLTFGLLSPNKGIEHAIQALPAILSHHPDVVYMVLGATHPHVKKAQGESYRQSLQQLTKELGLEANVIFRDQFVSLDELVEFIGAADIYITPYLNPAQIVSGTLAYTVGAGKAVISTPYTYAVELLDDGRGMIVPFQDASAIAEQVVYLLDNEAERHAMRKRAYLHAREMIWSKVAHLYMNSFESAIAGRIERPLAVDQGFSSAGYLSVGTPNELPAMNLNHLVRLTDGTGILQHAVFHLPNYSEGYTTDDNARALLLTVLLERLDTHGVGQLSPLSSRYLAFLWHAYNSEKGRFHNFLGFNRNWLDETGSEDCHGRALWALGAVVHRSSSVNLSGAAARLYSKALPVVRDFTSPRAWAFTLLSIHEYSTRFPGDRAVLRMGTLLAERLMDLYHQVSGPGWYWYENSLTYNNATLPQALFLASQWLKRQDMAEAALESLQWLVDIQTDEKGYFSPIGSNGFYLRGSMKTRFDQQPIEAWTTLSACLDIYKSTGEAPWYQEARRAFEWYLGKNDLGLPIYDPETGGCRDGLQPDRMNNNQGAESTLAFLLSLVEMAYLEPSYQGSADVPLLYPSINTTKPITHHREDQTW